MQDYREDMKAVRWTFWRVLPLVVITLIVLTATGFILNGLGLFGQKVIERKVFENSYQRTESLKSRIATDEAVLAEIEVKLRTPELDPNVRTSLEAQAAAARIRIRTAKEKLR